MDRFIQNGGLKGPAHDVIILSNSGFNTFRGFRSTGGQNLHCPIDFAGHIYNSAAATVQPVIMESYCYPVLSYALECFNLPSIAV